MFYKLPPRARYTTLGLMFGLGAEVRIWEGGGGRGSGPAWKITSYMGFYRNKQLDPPPLEKVGSPPGKCWAPSRTLKNDSFHLD